MVVMQYQVVIASVEAEPLTRAELRELLAQILEHTDGDYRADVVGSWPDLEYTDGSDGSDVRPSDAPDGAMEDKPDEVEKVDEGEEDAPGEPREPDQGESTGEAGQPPRHAEADVRPDEVDKVDEGAEDEPGEPCADVSLDVVDGIKCRVAQVGAPMSFYAFAEMCKRAGIPARRVAKCAGLSLNQWNYAHRTARFSDDVAEKLRQTYGVELIRAGSTRGQMVGGRPSASRASGEVK